METTQDAYLAKLRRTGWLDAVSAEERHRLESGVARLFASRKNPFTGEELPARETAEVFELYPSLAPISFDAEDAFLEPARTIDKLARGTYGRFRPENVEARPDEEGCVVSFVHDGRRVEWSTTHHDWRDDSLLVAINEALAASNVRERFHVLPAEDQWLHIVFVPPDVFERAQEESLFGSEAD